MVRGTVIRTAKGGRAGDGKDAGDDAVSEAGYTLLNMTRLQKAGSYDLLMASVVSPEPFSPGDEAPPMAMLRAPLGVEVRRVR